VKSDLEFKDPETQQRRIVSTVLQMAMNPMQPALQSLGDMLFVD